MKIDVTLTICMETLKVIKSFKAQYFQQFDASINIHAALTSGLQIYQKLYDIKECQRAKRLAESGK